MRVLLLTADYPPQIWSGIGVAVERQASALAALGHRVDVLVASATPLPPGGSGGPHVRMLTRDRCPVDPRDYDIIHLHSLSLSELALEWRQRTGLPLVYTAHSLVHLELAGTAQGALWAALQRELMARSDYVITLNRAERAAALELLPALAGRCGVLPNGVAPPRPAAPPPAGGPIVFAGRFAHSKGIDLLVELVPHMLAQRPCQFVLAGGHGDQQGERLAASLAVRFPAQCQLVGWLGRADLEALLARAALVLLPSRYEPFGLVAIEALRHGAPVLAAAVGGLAEIVAAHSGGVALRSRDPAVWSAAALALLDTPQAAELRRLGPAYVARNYDSVQLAQRLVDDVYAACGAPPEPRAYAAACGAHSSGYIV